jgi:hypothetical protein
MNMETDINKPILFMIDHYENLAQMCFENYENINNFSLMYNLYKDYVKKYKDKLVLFSK